MFNKVIVKERQRKRSVVVDAKLLFESIPTMAEIGSVDYLFEHAVQLEESVLAAAVSNYAICALYLRRIPTAVDLLESLILEDPIHHLTDPVVFNLCTLYDLSCSPEVSTTKKKVLQRFALKFHLDDPVLHWRSFRLN